MPLRSAPGVSCYLKKLKLKGSFIKLLRGSLLKKIDSLKTNSLKKLLFIINLYRMPLTESERKSLEAKVSKVIQELTLEETSLVACAFFKTEIKKTLQEKVDKGD